MVSLPAGWAEVRIGDVAKVVRGVTYKKGESSPVPADRFVPLLRSGNVRAEIEFDGLIYVPERLVRPDQMLEPEDIVVSTSNSVELVGKAAQLRKPWQGTFGAFCMAVRPGPHIDARYLGLFFQSPSYGAYIAGCSTATNNIANLRRGHLEDAVLPLPPLAAQRRIVQPGRPKWGRSQSSAERSTSPAAR